MLYLLTLILLLSIYIIVVLNMKNMKNYKVVNIIFASVVYVCYVSLVIIVYSDTGFYDWNFRNTLPVANISPFMFSIVPLVLLAPSKIRKHLYLLISLLCIGMFLSTVYNCFYNFNINYKFHFHFVLDYIAHFALSLWGIYLIRSKQVELKFRSCLISAGIIFGVVTLMLLLNVFLDTSYFGLSLNGKHNIYNAVITNNSYLSALIYYIGLCFILVLGYVFNKISNIKDNLYDRVEEKK